MVESTYLNMIVSGSVGNFLPSLYFNVIRLSNDPEAPPPSFFSIPAAFSASTSVQDSTPLKRLAKSSFPSRFPLRMVDKSHWSERPDSSSVKATGGVVPMVDDVHPIDFYDFEL